MPYTQKELRRIYKRTDGNCHLCGGKLCFKNYGKADARAAWEVEHSVCKANGGTDHGNNLFPAHISCNRSKGTLTSRTARSHNGRTCAPLSKEKKEGIRLWNALGGAAAGAMVGLRFGPPGVFVGLVAGCLVGASIDPEGK